MTAKEYLSKLQRLNVIIDQKLKEVGYLRSIADGVGCIDYSQERVSSSPSGEPPFVRNVIKIIELENEINKEIDFFVDEKHKIINEIHGLQDSRYIEILYKHYVEFKRLEVVAVEMNYTYQYVVELHGYALKEFQTTYPDLLKTYDE